MRKAALSSKGGIELAKGRKPGQMTHHRQKVLEEIAEAAKRGESITLARLARQCGLYDYREARRIKKDLERMRAI